MLTCLLAYLPCPLACLIYCFVCGSGFPGRAVVGESESEVMFKSRSMFQRQLGGVCECVALATRFSYTAVLGFSVSLCVADVWCVHQSSLLVWVKGVRG
jgi:hypothetical protein